MKLTMIQIALFFGGIIERPDLEIEKINSNMGNLFNTIPTVIPVPNEVMDIPVVQMKSSNGNYALNLARNRVDFIININPALSNYDDIIKKYKQFAIKLSEYYIAKIQIKRIGIVSRNFLAHQNPVQHIANKYFKDIVEGSFELNFRYNKRKKFNEHTINDVIEISQGQQLLNGNLTLGIIIQRDINNNLDWNKNLSKLELSQFIEKFYPLLFKNEVEELI